MLGPVASVAADPASERRNPGVEVPMPTLPSIINPPVGAAVVSYPLPKLPPPLTLNIDPGAVSPMPTLPVLSITNLSVVPSAVEDAIENLLLETSYPIVHEPAAAPENSNADFVAEYRVVRLFGVVVPMPTLPAKYAFPVVVAPPEMVSPPACVPSPMVEEA